MGERAIRRQIRCQVNRTTSVSEWSGGRSLTVAVRIRLHRLSSSNPTTLTGLEPLDTLAVICYYTMGAAPP